ncbi:hypothetical protein BB561_002387 [Smittium simulii]|uniref:Uncharacterized protein n=1 Tax=Smittium simulii TaxID=133385 RepID=A0A2T9YQL9_9FUNG|nr:hypothetical protein BB561_002391 [Smittium simulii]PVU94645.1 hypothetical protein BB561_002387 [Smittium simulii]
MYPTVGRFFSINKSSLGSGLILWIITYRSKALPPSSETRNQGINRRINPMEVILTRDDTSLRSAS